MALIRADRVEELTSTTGTSDFALRGAVTGSRGFAAVMADGDTCYYACVAVNAAGMPTGDWETGLGTLTGETLARTTVHASSTGAKVAFAVGRKRLVLTATATDVNGLANETVSAKDFGAVGDGVTDDTAAIQRAIDAVHAAGGGTVFFPDGDYLVSASTLSETYDNFGAPVLASACAIVQRAGVSLVGSDARPRIFTTDNTLLIIAQVAPVGCTLESLEIHAGWSVGLPGAGHGVFVLGTESGADISCSDNRYSNLTVHSVASYGIGLQNGCPTRCRLEDIEVYNTGADGLDLKARSDVATEPNGNTVNNVSVRNHGQRVTGSNGVDIRGIWHVSKISVTDFGGNGAFDYGGVRVRTKPPVGDAYNKAGARSVVSDVYVRPTLSASALSIVGVQNGSDDVLISGCVTEDCTYGYHAVGNVNGNPTRGTVTGFVAINSRIYGLYIVTGATDQTLVGCHTIGSVTAGVRNEGTNTRIIGQDSSGETTKISTSAGATPTEIITGGALGSEYGLTMTSKAAGRVGFEARGSSTNIDIHLEPKGSGVMRFGTHTTNADAAITGYVTIKDTSGTARKLAVIT